MKKSVFSVFLGLASLTLSLSASAESHYSGVGSWKSSTGASGDYSAATTVFGAPSTMIITDVIWSGDKTTTVKRGIVYEKDGIFFKVTNADEKYQKIGTGYCFPVLGLEMPKVCHADIDLPDFHIETSVNITKTAIYRTGSKTILSTGEKIIWQDELQLISSMRE